MHVPDTPNHVRACGGPPGTVLVAARRRLADRIMTHVGESGLLAAPCHSRVLESALALRLLDLTGHTRGRDDLARFLDARRRTEPAGTLDHVLADCTLRSAPLPDGVVTAALAGFDHFTLGRKRNLLQAIAVVFGRPRASIVPEPHDRAKLHPWASAVATASEVIIAGRATAGQCDELLAAQAHPGIWDGHLLCHLLTAHALRERPGNAGVIEGAVRGLLAARRPDGGIPFIERLDVFCSAIAGLGLSVIGNAAPHVRGIADRIAALQARCGGWGYATGVEQADVDTTAVAIELLTHTDPVRYAPQIDSGMAYLRDIQGEDGGFPTYRRGADSEVAMTAAATNAISLDQAQMLRGAANFIVRGQHRDGTFEPGWSRSTANTQCRVLLALNRAMTVADVRARIQFGKAISRSGKRLVRSQNADGGWGHVRDEHSDPISTAFALIGLARFPAGGQALPGGLRYLLSRQRLDGGFVSRPDSTGPRGFVYDVPVLADLYPLLAFGHLTDSTPAYLPA